MNDVIAIVRVKGENRQTVEQELLKGIVQDTRGNVLPGVTVLIKGNDFGCRDGYGRTFHLACYEPEECCSCIFFLSE